MAKFINNNSGSAKTYAGQSVPDGGYYQIPVNLEIEFAEDDLLVTDLATTGSGIIMSDDGLTDLGGGSSDQINFLKGVLVPKLKIENIGTNITQIVDDLGNNVEVLQGAQGDQGDPGVSGFGLYAFSNTDNAGTILKARGLTINKTGTGTYEYTFTTPAPDDDYIVSVSFFNLGTDTDTNGFINSKTVNGFIVTTGIGDNGTTPDTLADTNHSVTVLGDAGPQGITSAYESWLDIGNVGTEADFIASLESTVAGPQGPQGPPGDSQIRVSSNDSTVGFIEDKFIAGDSKISVTTANDGGDEDIVIQLQPSNIGTSELNNDANFIDSAGAPVQPSDIANFETTTQLNSRDTDNRNRTNHTGTQLASTISDFTSAVQSSETTTSLSFNGGTNILTFTDEDGSATNIDLSLFLDDTNLSRISSGVLNPTTGICTFTRDDLSTFTVDFSSLNDQSFINNAIDTHETTIGNHDDVDVTSTTPVSGDILEYDGTNWVPGKRPFEAFVQNSTPAGNNGTTYLTYETLSVTVPRTGNYKLDWSYIWSLNTTSNDFEFRVLQDGSTTLFEQMQEPQDSGGTGITITNLQGGTLNTGTDQRIPSGGFIILENLTAGAHTFAFQLTNQVAGTDAAIYRLASTIKEIV